MSAIVFMVGVIDCVLSVLVSVLSLCMLLCGAFFCIIFEVLI